MAWLFAGFALMFLASAAPRPSSARQMQIQAVAALLVLASMYASLSVYPDWVVITLFLASGALGLAVQWFTRLRIGNAIRIGAIVIGSAFVAFALLGPKDGLF